LICQLTADEFSSIFDGNQAISLSNEKAPPASKTMQVESDRPRGILGNEFRDEQRFAANRVKAAGDSVRAIKKMI